MAEALNDAALKAAFEGGFRTYCQIPTTAQWRLDYLAQVDRVRGAEWTTWKTPVFQQLLWENDGPTSLGPGGSVTVRGAYEDEDIARLLFQAREAPMPTTVEERGAYLEALYKTILSRVYPAYTDRRPRARILRLLAAMFPEHMTCLVDTWRIWRLQRALGSRILGGFVAQHPSVRDRLRSALGEPDDLASTIDQSIFTWFLWISTLEKPEEGAVLLSHAERTASDLPSLSMLPPNAQRRGLNCIKDNISVLMAMVREAEHGITREDLVAAILAEATFLGVTSTPNMISQAQGGLGLIRLADGAYVPTERGLDFLTADDPAAVLRSPLVGRVFGMGQLLKMLANEPGITQAELLTRLQATVPTWTTKMAPSQLLQWAKLVGFVRTELKGGIFKLFLTDEGEDYAAALPEDFETRWRLEELPPADVEGVPEEAHSQRRRDPPVLEPYSIAHIVEDGCFMAPEELTSALELLRRKKNLVLQGPPGTGKTWLAKRLGYALLGERDRLRVTAVQFQPSLSYEDFVRGWRPDGKAGLRLADGVFLEIVEAALRDSEQDHVLVIEEINRGNPAQIFGELLTLLEADKRDPDEALRLAYPRFDRERVYVPKNLYVIGTMNLADRSLALVDLALRRRFAFLTLKPLLGSRWRAWCQKAGAPNEVMDVVSERLNAVNNAIAQDPSLGDQFCIGHSFATPPAGLTGRPRDEWRAWYRSVVETEIAPLLSEYWYDDANTAAKQRASLLQGF